MATAKNVNTDTTNNNDDAPAIVDGIYTENVTIHNGETIPVEVIVDADLLPATFGSLVSEGNAAALVIAQLTTTTRRYLDLLGANQKDLKGVIGDVVKRARAMAKDSQ